MSRFTGRLSIIVHSVVLMDCDRDDVGHYNMLFQSYLTTHGHYDKLLPSGV